VGALLTTGRPGGGATNPGTLPREFLARPAIEVAPGLLGCVVTAGGVSVRLVEVEAYAGVGADPGSHAHRGRTARNAAMFERAGTLYVYFTYGMHWCANVVTGAEGEGTAVLLRAGEVVAGLDLARSRRPRSSDRDLARGPARLAQCLGLDRSADGTDVLDGSGPVLLTPGVPPLTVLRGPRTGVARGHDTPWRFWSDGEPTVSPYRPAVRRDRRPRDGGGSVS
jgi:DNA-3-methyladenine glycosylase